MSFKYVLIAGLGLLIAACDQGASTNAASVAGAQEAAAPVRPDGGYQLGRAATADEIAGWDIDIRPDGQGLPPGQGSVMEGEALYEAQCASCHGVFGEGEGRWPKVAGGFGSLTDDRPEKSVGSYWPYLSTVWDYVHRAMPFLQPQSLEDDEVYAITAYLLYLNELVEDDFVLSRENFTSVRLPNEANFVKDPRPDVENTRCMDNCRDPETIQITWDSTELNVTPTDHLEDSSASLAEAVVEVAMTPAEMGEGTYKNACAMCHDGGIAGAPVTGDASAWEARIAQGMDILVKHAIEGYQGSAGYMPAKGGNSALSDDAVENAVIYMVSSSE